MQVTLAQAISAINAVKKQVYRYNEELQKVAYETVGKGEEAPAPERPFVDVFVDLQHSQNDLVDLKTIIRTVNINETIAWDGVDLPIAKAIELAKILRDQAQTLAGYGKAKKKESVRSYVSTEASFRIALFDPKFVAETAEQYERKANRLSSLIEARNHSINLDIPFLDKYL
jgi:hypothetical protein